MLLAGVYKGGKNNTHQSLDMVLDEDHYQIRQQSADQNMSILCYAFSNVLSSDKDKKVGIKIKQQITSLDNDCLLELL